MKNKTITIVVMCVSSLGIGFLAGWYFCDYQPRHASTSTTIRANSSEYKFINPILLSGDQDTSKELEPLSKKIDRAISDLKQQPGSSVQSTSVYFRDMNSGRWTGVNEDAQYAPSSMLKVVMMVGYLKDAETDPTLFNKKFTYEQDISGQHYPPQKTLTNGPHSVTELISAMILESDNAALNALFANNREAFINVFKSLHLPPPASLDAIDFMSPKVFSGLFRALYNGTYLTRPVSEAALSILSATSFTQGLVAGLPKGVVIAHKFGEHTQNDINGKPKTRELHDCGIIYYPTRPYFLCVMTKGGDFTQLESVISTVSRTVHDYVSSNNI